MVPVSDGFRTGWREPFRLAPALRGATAGLMRLGPLQV